MLNGGITGVNFADNVSSLLDANLDTETIVSLFDKAAQRRMESTALSFGDLELTYSDLYRKSGQVANALVASGVSKGDFVAIYMERSPETVVSVLGILRAGGVYVPIDPENPMERNRYIVENCNCKHILLKGKYESSAEDLVTTVNKANLFRLESILASADPAFTNVALSPDDLAYVIYTSGSTGLPKGTLLAHRGVVNLCKAMTIALQLSESDVVTQFSTFSFDASVVDTFETLLNGAHLAMLTKEEQLTPEFFVDLLERRGVTQIGCLPTSVFNRIAETTTAETKTKWSTVKAVVIGGEPLLSDHVRKFQDKFGTTTSIVNAYGPTECTVVATTYKISEYWDKSSITVPIGYALDGYTLYVVRPDGSLAEVNEEGELYIETVGVAKGYLNLPEKTDEVFVTNRFNPDSGTKVYKSGDIVKRLEDGSIEFQHRKDGQLKLRGFRIEIGEIENALSKHPAILDAAVVAIKDNNVVRHLSCFFSEKERVSLSDLKRHLRDYVPYYMVPNYFYRLQAIPLSASGKVDRNKLHSMDNPELADSDEPYETPVGDIEHRIAEIWSELLEVTKVGRNSNFFDIGGDSLAVMAVLSHLKFDYPDLRMNDLYEYKTVKDLAAYVSTLSGESLEEEVEITEYYDLTELPVLPKVGLSGRDGLGSDIFLTGATGYLGSHLLVELLKSTTADIHVLVRPKLGEGGISRLWETLDSYFGPNFFVQYTDRIFVLEGDITLPNLGLVAEDLDFLLPRVTSIVHAGADVRHFGNAEDFKNTNVAGTQNLLNLVYGNPSISFHFVSTLGIPEDIAAAGLWESVAMNASDFYQVELESVYTNSKLLAEKLVVDAVEAGLACSIYRAGNLSCHSETGHFQKNINENFFYRMLKSFLLLGKAPIVNAHLDITPIDFASRFMVALMKRTLFGEVYHVCNSNQELYERLVEALKGQGYAIELLPMREFERWVLLEGNKISPEGVQLAMGLLDGDGVRTTPNRYSSEESFKKAEGLEATPSLTILLERLVKHAVGRGYFPSPAGLELA